jgi:hypothetical protein
MTTVRIAYAEPQPGKLANGGFQTRGHLVVLADDARRRAVPVWMRGDPGEGDLSQLVEFARRPAGEIVTADAPQVLTARLLGAAGASVTGVDIEATGADLDELSPQVTVPPLSTARAQSCPRRCRVRPDRPPWSRPSSLMTTAAPRSSSTATSAPSG